MMRAGSSPRPAPHATTRAARPRPADRSRPARAVLWIAVAALTGALTACSGSSGSGGSAGSDGGSDAGGSSSGAFPATVKTKFGEVTVPEEPKTVVALGWGDAEAALALGVQPAGASDWLEFGGDGVGPWAKGKYDKSPQLIGTLEPEYEKVAALQPDLILDTKSSGSADRYRTLSKIAPTVGVPRGGEEYQTTWKKQTEMVAEALGRHRQGAKLIAGTERKFAAAKKAHPEFRGKTIALGSRTGSGYGAYVRGGGRVDFVERLGFKNNPAVEAKAGKSFSVPVSEENLDLLDADLTVMTPIGVQQRQITGDPLYRALPSVRDGRSLVFDEAASSAFATDSVLSVSYALDKVVPLLADRVK